ncbi:hypothetical protein BH09ACT12_BH09ACT12_24300 [soil metagenome]
MGTDEDDSTLFTLGSPEARPAPDRTTLLRQTLGGALLIVAAAAAAWLLPVVLTDGPAQSDDTVLPIDDAPHRAQSSADRESMLWFDESVIDPTCVIRYGATGEVLPTSATDRSDTRYLGSAGDWVGVATFEPVSDSVEVTCSEASGIVLVSQAPGGAAGLIALGVIILIPLALAMSGLVLLVAAATSLVQARAARAA